MVEENEFLHCCEWYDNDIVVIGRFVDTDRPKTILHENIVFRRNRFIGENPNLFTLECCRNVEISDNTYTNTKDEVDECDISPIKLTFCKDIVIQNNTFSF